VAELGASRGHDGVVLKYRVPRPDNMPTRRPRADAAKTHSVPAGACTQQPRERVGHRPNKIGILGFSAGGHLTANGPRTTQACLRPIEIDQVSCRPDLLSRFIRAGIVDRETKSMRPR